MTSLIEARSHDITPRSRYYFALNPRFLPNVPIERYFRPPENSDVAENIEVYRANVALPPPFSPSFPIRARVILLVLIKHSFILSHIIFIIHWLGRLLIYFLIIHFIASIQVGWAPELALPLGLRTFDLGSENVGFLSCFLAYAHCALYARFSRARWNREVSWISERKEMSR